VLSVEFEGNQRGNRNSYIEEEQITQWPKEKVQRTNNDLKHLTVILFCHDIVENNSNRSIGIVDKNADI
jgi:hypothetical protein